MPRMVPSSLTTGRLSTGRREQGAWEEGGKGWSVTVRLARQGRCLCGGNAQRGTKAIHGSLRGTGGTL